MLRKLFVAFIAIQFSVFMYGQDVAVMTPSTTTPAGDDAAADGESEARAAPAR